MMHCSPTSVGRHRPDALWIRSIANRDVRTDDRFAVAANVNDEGRVPLHAHRYRLCRDIADDDVDRPRVQLTALGPQHIGALRELRKREISERTRDRDAIVGLEPNDRPRDGFVCLVKNLTV
jgi:hypothetical protein